MSARALPVVALLLVVAAYQAQTRSDAVRPITSPRQQFGASIGDDYFLATYAQLETYWQRLAQESDRVRLSAIGATEEGRTHWMAVVSSPENLAHLDRYREIARRLALAEGLSAQDARALAREGKAVVWINGGLHADEVLGAQQLIELVYQLASRSDAEVRRVLRDVIVLAVHANPDGHALVADWYMREPDPRRRTLADLPRAYQKYVGHDNNRDFFLATQAETINMNRVLYREWFPQIVYDHHQPAPDGTVMFAPPFAGPVNPMLDPLIPSTIEMIGAAMHARFAAEGKPGVTMRRGGPYSTWWNGGLRTTAYFHNQVGLLTETIGSPTPSEIPFVAARQDPSPDLPHPIAPQRWRFRQSIDYSMTANWAVLDAASRLREMLLLNAYRMGARSIERGREGAPRAYVLPADQRDFATATKLVDALLKGGVSVHRATGAVTADGRTFPPGSYVVKTAQAFRPHVLDMFEPQTYPGGELDGSAPLPYDMAGWTLAMQMGVAFERVAGELSGPLEKVENAVVRRGTITGAPSPRGYLLDHHSNDAAIVVNRLLAAGAEAYWLQDRTLAGDEGTGAIYISADAAARPIVERAAEELGLSFTGVAVPPAGGAYRLRRTRVGLWDRYGGAVSSGWARWILEQYEFPFDRVYAQALDAGRLIDRYDVLILTDEAVPGRGGHAGAADVPAAYRHTTGAMRWDTTVPALAAFVEQGGTLVAIGGATVIAPALGVPVATHDAGERGAHVPGSVLRVRVDQTTPLGYGFARHVDVLFDDSPVFTVAPGARGVRRLAWFADRNPLRSGWARGAENLHGALAGVEARVGRGRVVLFGPEILFRAQSHGTFKFLFNGIHAAGAQPVASVD